MINPEQKYVSAAGFMFDRIYPMFQKALDVENGAYYGLMKKAKMKAAISAYDRILDLSNTPYNEIVYLHIRNSDGFEELVENMYSAFIGTVSKRKEALQCLLTETNVSNLNAINISSKAYLTAFQNYADQVLSMIKRN